MDFISAAFALVGLLVLPFFAVGALFCLLHGFTMFAKIVDDIGLPLEGVLTALAVGIVALTYAGGGVLGLALPFALIMGVGLWDLVDFVIIQPARRGRL